MSTHINLHNISSIELGEVRQSELPDGRVYYSLSMTVNAGNGSTTLTLFADTREALEQQAMEAAA